MKKEDHQNEGLLPTEELEGKRFRVRIFRDDEVTEVVYHNVTHAFWTNRGTVLTICLPDQEKHANWLREQICHYDVTEEE